MWPAGAVLLLVLGGCGAEPEAPPASAPAAATSSDAPEPSRPTGTAAAEDLPRSGTAGFVAAVQRTMPALAVDRREDENGTLARHACAALGAGRSADAVVAEVRTFGTDDASARTLVRLAIGTVCPGQDHRAGEF